MVKRVKWLERIDKDGKTGLKCKVCSHYGKTPRNGKGSWCITPCFALKKDKIAKHEKSSMRTMAAKADTAAGGLGKSFSDQISLEMIGCLKYIIGYVRMRYLPRLPIRTFCN